VEEEEGDLAGCKMKFGKLVAGSLS